MPKDEAEDLGHTIDLDLEPFEGSTRQLLLRGPVIKGIRNVNFGEVFQNRTLHSQLVEIRVEEGDHPLGKG